MSVPYQGNSTKSAVPGIKGTNSVTDTGDATANAIGVYGESNGSAPAARLVLAGVARSVPYSGAGVWGESKGTGAGVAGFNMNASGGPSEYASGGPGVYGESQNAHGVLGFTHGVHEPELTAGVAGISLLLGGKAPGVYGESKGGAGVAGVSHNGPGVSGESQTAEGLIGTSNSRGKAGVAGFASFGTGAGVYGESKGTGAGVSGVTNGTGPGIYGESRGGGAAGFFNGDVHVTGDIFLTGGDCFLTGGDCAEHFEIEAFEEVEPGTVMVIEAGEKLRPCSKAYDKRVVGVVSGAGSYRPGIVLGAINSDPSKKRRPIALIGKVYCRVDATCDPIEIGDLLTTSPTVGYAMKAKDPKKAFGAVIGKALYHLKEGQGLIPILIAIQ